MFCEVMALVLECSSKVKSFFMFLCTQKFQRWRDFKFVIHKLTLNSAKDITLGKALSIYFKQFDDSSFSQVYCFIVFSPILLLWPNIKKPGHPCHMEELGWKSVKNCHMDGPIGSSINDVTQLMIRLNPS